MENFSEVYGKLQETQAYKSFRQEHSDYTLAHGFVQLDANEKPSKPWHIGFYSPKKDDLAIFTSPDFALSFDKAFKDGGKINELKVLPGFQPTQEVLAGVKDHLQKNYPVEKPFTYLIILQMIDGNPRYNITIVTQAFKMLNFQVDPLTATIVQEKVQSVMDLKAEE